MQLRVLRSRPGRVQISPHAYRVISSWKSRVKSVDRSIDRSTCSSPSTSRRTFIPSSSLSAIPLERAVDEDIGGFRLRCDDRLHVDAHLLHVYHETVKRLARRGGGAARVAEHVADRRPLRLPRAGRALELAEQVDARHDLTGGRDRDDGGRRVALVRHRGRAPSGRRELAHLALREQRHVERDLPTGARDQLERRGELGYAYPVR